RSSHLTGQRRFLDEIGGASLGFLEHPCEILSEHPDTDQLNSTEKCDEDRQAGPARYDPAGITEDEAIKALGQGQQTVKARWHTDEKAEEREQPKRNDGEGKNRIDRHPQLQTP